MFEEAIKKANFTEWIREDLRYEDRCPNCHCALILKTRIPAGMDETLEWFKKCSGCHAEFIILRETLDV